MSANLPCTNRDLGSTPMDVNPMRLYMGRSGSKPTILKVDRRNWFDFSKRNRTMYSSVSSQHTSSSSTAGVQVGARVPAGAAVYSVTRDEWMNAREVRDA